MTLINNLTQEEMDHICADEHFRASIRKKIELEHASPKKTNNYWEFLNSSFGLWLLSAIFISGLGTLLSNHHNAVQKHQQEEEADRAESKNKLERIDRISMEISYRLSTSMIKLKAASKSIKDKTKENAFKLKLNALTPLSRPATDELPPLFPEFKNYSGLALIAELRTITEPGERKVLKDKLTALSALLYTTGSSNMQNPQAIESLAGDLINITQFKNTRWNNGFYFNDCTKDKPFC